MTNFDLATQQHIAAGIKPIKSGEVPHELDHHIRSMLAFIVVKQTFFAALLYGELKIVYTEDVPVAATDGLSVYINPWNYRERKMAHGAFIFCHEVLHYVRGDCLLMHKWNKAQKVLCPSGKYLPYIPQLMNIAEDYIINAMLSASGMEVPEDALYDRDLSVAGMESSLEVYETLYRRCNGRTGGLVLKGGRYGQGTGKPFDFLIMPSDSQAADDNPQKRTQAIAAAAEVARGQGQLPACIQKLLGELLEPKVSWQDQLVSTIHRRAGEPGYDWRLPDKRLIIRTPDPIFFARPTSYGCGTMGIGVDVSGSIYSDMRIVQRFFSEMVGMIEQLNPARLVVFWCDADVARVDDLEEPSDLDELRFDINREGGMPGGGGTDFRPVFDTIAKLDEVPDLLVYFTDGYGTFPDKPPEYPVIWGMITDCKAPWGDVVRVEL